MSYFLARSLVDFFFFNDTATTEIYTLSLHDALPIFPLRPGRRSTAIDSVPPSRCCPVDDEPLRLNGIRMFRATRRPGRPSLGSTRLRNGFAPRPAGSSRTTTTSVVTTSVLPGKLPL